MKESINTVGELKELLQYLSNDLEIKFTIDGKENDAYLTVGKDGVLVEL